MFATSMGRNASRKAASGGKHCTCCPPCSLAATEAATADVAAPYMYTQEYSSVSELFDAMLASASSDAPVHVDSGAELRSKADQHHESALKSDDAQVSASIDTVAFCETKITTLGVLLVVSEKRLLPNCLLWPV